MSTIFSKTFKMRILLFAVFICLACASPTGRQIEHLDHPDKVSGEFLVMLHVPTGKETNEQYTSRVVDQIAAKSPKVTVVKSFTNLKTPILHVKATDDMELNQLFQLDEVDIIETNRYVKIQRACSVQNSGENRWGLSRISSIQRPDYQLAQYRYEEYNGQGVQIYVLDTGIMINHEEFDNGRARFGANTIGGGNDDIHGHGTHCAGIAAGQNSGIARQSTVVAVKVLNDDGNGHTASIIGGFNWVVGDVLSAGWRGVCSVSIANFGVDLLLFRVLKDTVALDIPVVVAAGNDDDNACMYSPGGSSSAITVGATDINDELASFSNHGVCVDILAPGENILSASNNDETELVYMSGTSMACPFVAGLAAKYLGDNLGATSADVKKHLLSTTAMDQIGLRNRDRTPNRLLHYNCP